MEECLVDYFNANTRMFCFSSTIMVGVGIYIIGEEF